MTIDFDRYALRIDGRRTLIRSGALHYFRLPAQTLWRDRLQRLKTAGYNTVDLYFHWGYHNPRPGVWDFTGIRDIDHLLNVACEVGLYVIARPGPYINAELSGGGFPGWLLAQPDVILRHRLPDGRFEWSEPYMAAVADWWDQIVPRIARCPNVILMQIENEYATLEMEPDYLRALTHMSRALGITVPLFHNDLYAAGLYEESVDLYAFDNYSVTSFDSDWRTREGIFAVIDSAEAAFRPFCAHRPLFAAELQAGWFSGREGVSHEAIAARLGRAHLALSTKSLLAQGATLFNHYLAVGGTNWGTLGSTDVGPSYDFAAPLSEAGLSTERLYEAKALNTLLASFDLSATEPEPLDTLPVTPSGVLIALRRAVGTPAAAEGQAVPRWAFLRNMSPREISATLTPHGPVMIRPHECLMLPLDWPLACTGWTLLHTSVEPLAQSAQLLLLHADRPVLLALQAPEPLSRDDLHAEQHNGFSIQADSDTPSRLTITHPALGDRETAWIRLGSLTLGLLGSACRDRLWTEPDGRLVIGPDEAFGQRLYGFGANTPRTPLILLDADGHKQTLPSLPPYTPSPLPRLGPWQAASLMPSRHSGHYWLPVCDRGPDLDANGLFADTGAWLRYDAPPGEVITHVTLSARHLWAVFLDGRCVGHGQHWHDPALAEQPPTPHTLTIPPCHAPEHMPHTLWIRVDSLGRSKGYHDDARSPQGLLSLYVNGRDVSDDLAISPGLSPQAASAAPPQASPAVRFECRFPLVWPGALYQPLGLLLGNFPATLIDVALNGLPLARVWPQTPEKTPQTPLVLPEGVLNPDGMNTLTLDALAPDPFLSVDPAEPALAGIELVSLGAFTKWLL